ncbi:MAG: hypothetical protein Kow00117_08580 [Phototrophicales bacterium]
MLERLAFYFRHSTNDLRVNGQRTLFALLCIAAGVAAIVSLQTLAVMIENTLTGNLQQQNRGDLHLTYYYGNQFGPDDETQQEDVADVRQRDRQIDAAARDGLLGYRNTREAESNDRWNYLFTPAGIQAIQSFLDERFPGQAELTYTWSLAGFGEQIFGNAPGATMTRLDNGDSLAQLTVFMVDGAVYPYYNTITTQDGKPLSEVLVEPTDVVITEMVAENLGVQVGDRVIIDGATTEFVVRGIVPTASEIRDPFTGVFLSLFGYYYLDIDAIDYFESVNPVADSIYIRLQDPSLNEQVAAALTEEFSYLRITTTEDLRELNEEIATNLDTLVTVMGLLSMLLGSIGIINTMQVVVRRRTLEIAVLKTIGLQGNQVTMLFLVQAFMMGVIGSLFGVLLGWGTVFVIRGVAENLLSQTLPFQIAAEPVLVGLVVGTVVTTVFGFLPTLSAGQVRPGIVLRPTETIIPRAGCLATLVSLIGTIFVLSVIARIILGGKFVIALVAVIGAFIGAGVVFVLLWVMIWLVGRLLPSFGLVDLKLSKRQMLSERSRGAITLLALVVAVFSLSTITLFADSFTNLLNSLLEDEQAYPVIVQAPFGGTAALNRSLEIIQQSEVVEKYSVSNTYENVSLVSIETTTGEQYQSINDVIRRVRQIAQANNGSFVVSDISQLNSFNLNALPTNEILEGRRLNETDIATPGLVLMESDATRYDVIGLGDQITLKIKDQTITFTVVGIAALPQDTIGTNIAFNSFTLNDVVAGIPPDDAIIAVDVDATDMGTLRRELSVIPGVFIFDLRMITNLVETLLAQFRAFPTMVALLGLVVGGVVIANSVALATLERRKQIAVMKSVGLQRERVLIMLLLEYGLLGLIGGLLGVGSGLVTLVVISADIDLPLEVIPFGAAFLLMALCVAVALIAASTTAWGAASEKPLNVLRYE